MLAENKRSTGSGGNRRQVLLLRESARVQQRVALHHIDFGSTDQRHFQSDRPQRLVEPHTARSVVGNRVRAGADGGEHAGAFRKIIGRVGDESVAIGGKHSRFTVRKSSTGVTEIKTLDLVDIWSVEARIGKISLRNESRDATVIRSTTGTKQKRNQAQAQI